MTSTDQASGSSPIGIRLRHIRIPTVDQKRFMDTTRAAGLGINSRTHHSALNGSVKANKITTYKRAIPGTHSTLHHTTLMFYSLHQ
ncbi:hypothetical protein E4U58_005517 [Claviceps cyperi]|nr:hypothetical protein E4U58_005517 [Claviceps cyperi]